MLNIVNAKIYRKCLILAVLAGSLFIFTSLNRVSAIPCCIPMYEACEATYSTCVINCNVYQGIPAKYAQCVSACDGPYYACLARDCNPTC